MNDLRTRIVAVQADHVEGQLTNYDDDGREECGCGHQGNATYREHLADAVIRELKQEWLVDMGYGGLEPFDTREEAINRMAEINEDWGDDPPEAGVLLMSRYVTDWKADDE